MNDPNNLFSFPEEGENSFFDLGSTPGFNPFAADEEESVGLTTPPAEPPTPVEVKAPEPTPVEKPAEPMAVKAQTETQAAAPAAQPAGNLLEMAMQKQEEADTRKAAAPIFAQPPVFKFSTAEEEITDPKLTFEGLRAEKESDFPEFADGSKVSWSMTYGKIVKQVSDPKKKVIYDLKKEIEASKEFVDALKKSKDKSPKCIVTPRVTAKSKGRMSASYKGIFPTIEDAQASDKVICFVPSRDGQMYELRKTEQGQFITPTANMLSFDEVKAGFIPALPLIPYELIREIITLFRHLCATGSFGGVKEALAYIYWDKEMQRFFTYIPQQKVTATSVEEIVVEDYLYDTSRFIHYADIHSHNTMAAVFSKTDDADEQGNRLYIVVGRLDQFYPEITVRICNVGTFWPVAPESVMECPYCDGDFSDEWLERIASQRRFVRGVCLP